MNIGPPIIDLPAPLGYIFRILQHFAAKLCHCTNVKILFLAVVKDYVLPVGSPFSNAGLNYEVNSQ